MPTIKDVANRAGVSVGTVSMVINGSKSVKMETRYRVMEVIREMGYVPNQYARSLVTRKKHVIGVIRQNHLSSPDSLHSGYRFNEIPDTYLADMLDSIVHELSALGYSLLLDVAAWSSADEAVPLEYSLLMTNRLKELGANVEMNILPGVPHNCWNYAYEQTDLLPWLAAQKRVFKEAE